MSENKNSLLLTNVHVLYVLEDKTSKKNNFRLSVCLSVGLSVRTWTFHVDTITFEGVSGSKQNMVGVFYVWNVGLVKIYFCIYANIFIIFLIQFIQFIHIYVWNLNLIQWELELQILFVIRENSVINYTGVICN